MNEIKEKKKPFFFSVDFEDISHDLIYNLTKNPKIKIRENIILKSYEKFKYLNKKYLGNKGITFFTTGILVKKYPDIIREIINDGHEIACHHDHHDIISKKNQSNFSYELDNAIEVIEKISGNTPKGYRAPIFSINKGQDWAYFEIAKRFIYDSSIKTSKRLIKKNQDNFLIYGDNKLFEFYIYEKSLFFDKLKFKSGGSYFRLFNENLICSHLNETRDQNHIPIVYLHPYDLLSENEFWVKLSELKNIKNNMKFIYWLKQNLWHKLGNKTVEKKIKFISNHYENIGKMGDYKFIN